MLRLHVVEQAVETSGGKPMNYGHPQLITVPNCVSLERLQNLLLNKDNNKDENNRGQGLEEEFIEPVLYLVDDTTDKCSR